MAQDWISVWQPWASPAVSAIAAALSCYFFWRNRTLSDRSVKIEAQKLLLEFNRQLIADPKLWAIYDAEGEAFKDQLTDKEFQLKLRAIGNLVINMFDLKLSQLPKGPERDAWHGYFKDTITRSQILRKILTDHEGRDVYTPELLESWKEIKKSIR